MNYHAHVEKCKAKDPTKCRFHGNINPLGSDDKVTQILSLMSPKSRKLREVAREVLQKSIAGESGTEEELTWLASQPNPSVRAIVASNPEASEKLLDFLSFDDDFHVRAKVAANPSTPENVTVRILKGSDEQLKSLVAKTTENPKLLTLLRKDMNPLVRVSVANNENTLPSDLFMLCQDEDRYVVEAVTSNPHTPPAGLDRATYTARLTVAAVRNIASNPYTQVHTLGGLVKNNSDEIALAHIAAHNNSSSHIIGELIGNDDYRVRVAVAGRKDLSLNNAKILAHDSDVLVRHALARNPDTHSAILKFLALKDPDQNVRDESKIFLSRK